MYSYYNDITGETETADVESWRDWFNTSFDEEQKRDGTTFETWLYDMIKAGLLTNTEG